MNTKTPTVIKTFSYMGISIHQRDDKSFSAEAARIPEGIKTFHRQAKGRITTGKALALIKDDITHYAEKGWIKIEDAKPLTIKVTIDDKTIEVRRDGYIMAKRKQLVEFGYANLTIADVEKQLELVEAGHTIKNGGMDHGLTVIGGFMESEVSK